MEFARVMEDTVWINHSFLKGNMKVTSRKLANDVDGRPPLHSLARQKHLESPATPSAIHTVIA